MKSTAEYIELLRDFKNAHAADYGIERLGIFGSVARGDHREDSDVDICVEMIRPDMFLLIGIRDSLQELLGCKVDIVRLRARMNPFLSGRIHKEALYV